jgi:hypothetical protein
MKKTLFILALFLSFGCSTRNLRDISPKEYRFSNELVQSKWDYYLNLSDCEKVSYVDSIFSIVPLNKYKKYLDSNFVKKDSLDESLAYYHKGKLENFYYWIFREIEFITGSGLSIPVTHYGYYGLTNRQVAPGYLSRDGYEKFKYDVKRWKDSLGCD